MNASASEVAASAQTVSSSVGEQKSAIDSVDAESHRLADMSASLSDLVGQFCLDAGEGLAKRVEASKGQHLKWVERVEVMLNGGKMIPQHELVSHRQCALGRWYYGIGSRDVGGRESFRSIEEPHARLHAAARRAVEAMEQKRPEEARRMLDEMRVMSRQILQNLDLLCSADGHARAAGQVKPVFTRLAA